MSKENQSINFFHYYHYCYYSHPVLSYVVTALFALHSIVLRGKNDNDLVQSEVIFKILFC